MTIISDYDEFGIYTNSEDIEKYIESLFRIGIENQDEIYNMCIANFGKDYIDIINELFSDDETH